MSEAATASEYTVLGMTCGHCVSSVTEEVTALDGVHNVDVDLATGALRLDIDRSVSRNDIRAAVQEAGYELA
jgi:copper ion binding protein